MVLKISLHIIFKKHTASDLVIRKIRSLLYRNVSTGEE